MSIQHYPLYEFITRVPSCDESTPMREVLYFYERQQDSAQLVVLNEQQVPLYLLDATNLLALLIYGRQQELGNTHYDDWDLPISCLDGEFIQPIQTLSSSLSLEQFGSKLRNQKLPAKPHNWLLVDEYGKFIGLLDSCKLLARFALSQNKNEGLAITLEKLESEFYQEAGKQISVLHRNLKTEIHSDNAEFISYADAKDKIHQRKTVQRSQLEYKYAAQLLKGLPWALMLETDTREVVSQNQLWYEQLGELKDPYGLKELWERTIEENVVSPTDVVNPESNKSGEGTTLNRCFIDGEPGS
ncbi:MAG: hypothetical protein MJK14_03080, partial [Rivularia sp. ALOHA_DT_140]|nr:hypothetical protein [Rivularia sp. ALOHA_DT_140]